MADAVALHRNASGRGRQRLDIRLAGPARSFRLEIEAIRRAMTAHVPDRLVDLLEIAACVFAADQSFSRGGLARRDWGADWRREIDLVVPVRDLAFWQRAEVGDALVRTLAFLSEDDWRLAFTASGAPPPLETYLPLGDGATDPFRPDEVALFSGGADSLAGAVEVLARGGRVALVTHRASPKMRRVQEDLLSALRRRYPDRVLPVGVHATRTGEGHAKETTQRSRTFLYAALGFVLAEMLGGVPLRFYENGPVSVNLPITEQFVGASATRSTHPLGIALMRHLLDLVAERPVTLDTPFFWRTKAEVFAVLRESDAAGLVRHSVSCSHIYTMTRAHPHCGRCSQCVDRRFGVLAAGLEDADPAGNYEIDLLTGARESLEARIIATDYTRHAVALAEMDEDVFFTRFMGEITRVREGFPEMGTNEVATRCLDLFRRHGRAVAGVLEAAVIRHSRALVAHALPSTALLALHLGGGTAEPAQTPVPPEPDPEAPREIPADAGGPPQIRLDVDRRTADILGLATLTGRGAELIAVLKGQYDADLAAASPLAEHACLTPDRIADALGLTDAEGVRQVVKRLRDEVSEAHALIAGGPAPKGLVVENLPRKGYRLNPAVRFVR